MRTRYGSQIAVLTNTPWKHAIIRISIVWICTSVLLGFEQSVMNRISQSLSKNVLSSNQPPWLICRPTLLGRLMLAAQNTSVWECNIPQALSKSFTKRVRSSFAPPVIQNWNGRQGYSMRYNGRPLIEVPVFPRNFTSLLLIPTVAMSGTRSLASIL